LPPRPGAASHRSAHPERYRAPPTPPLRITGQKCVR
jgi:hypothetical protein